MIVESPSNVTPATPETLDTGDAQMSAILRRVGKVRGRDIPILILGKTGTGKGMARARDPSRFAAAHGAVRRVELRVAARQLDRSRTVRL